MSPRVRSAPDLSAWMSRKPGTAEPVGAGVTRERGGAVDATCGVCGNRARIEVRPSRCHNREALLVERALRRAGWLYAEPWGVVEKECLRTARKAVRAGHVQLTLL